MGRKRAKSSTARRPDPAAENFQKACDAISAHPMFTPLKWRISLVRSEISQCPSDGWAVVTSEGHIHVHPSRRAEAEEWIYVLAHCLLHLGLGHFPLRERRREWNAACDCIVAAFLADFKLGRPPEAMRGRVELSVRDEGKLYEQFCRDGIPRALQSYGTAGPTAADMLAVARPPHYYRFSKPPDWPALFGEGLSQAVRSAVLVAGGYAHALGEGSTRISIAEQARRWFINSFPLLGSLAAAFKIIEDPKICARLSISIAAVDMEAGQIFINPAAALSEMECRFVMAHELLHVGLRHDVRCRGREPYLWNVACDYVINAWLIEMGVGDFPRVGGLHDPELKDMSAEAIYDLIVTDIRRFRKLATLRGIGLGDILAPRVDGWWISPDGMRLDDFYRACLTNGLSYHEGQGRGLLPAGLVQEIRALSQPPIPWDVELAQWFDRYFAPLEKLRTYARPSRRQSSTPDIPRPRWVPAPGAEDGRTFGVVLDTSGSMNLKMLGKALGAIASYSMSRDVPAVRVVFCDAATYDQGYMPPEAIAGRVRIKGRGGTVLQPAIDLLEGAEDFPKKGPILIVTDGECDPLRIRRDHAFLMPPSSRLHFPARGEVFRMTE